MSGKIRGIRDTCQKVWKIREVLNFAFLFQSNDYFKAMTICNVGPKTYFIGSSDSQLLLHPITLSYLQSTKINFIERMLMIFLCRLNAYDILMS